MRLGLRLGLRVGIFLLAAVGGLLAQPFVTPQTAQRPFLTLVTNTVLTVNAGPDQTVAILTVNLTGTVVPTPGTVMWSVVSKPAGANVAFGDIHALTTTATVDLNGSYLLRLSATKNQTVNFDDILAFVNVAANTAPFIVGLHDVTFNEASSTNVAFTIGDDVTSMTVANLSKSTDNSNLLPTGGIVFGGSGTNLTVTFTPNGDSNGIANVNFTIVDGGGQVRTYPVKVTVLPVNDLPTITAANIAMPEDTTTNMSYTVFDKETAAASLAHFVTILDTNIIRSVTLGGSGTNRTALVALQTNVSGVGRFTLTVNDGSANASKTVTNTVSAVNDAPTIATIQDVHATNGFLATRSVTIADVDNTAAELTTAATSDAAGVVANSGLVISGTGLTRTLTITPAGNGTANVSVVVTDAGGAKATNIFVVTVAASANTAPTLASIADQNMFQGTTISIPATVGDAETAVGSLLLTATTASPLFPNGFTLGGSGANRTIGATATVTGAVVRIGVPAYFSPSGPYWGQFSAAATGGFVIANPNSGPGASLDATYVSTINTAKSKGLRVLGYVATGYGGRSAATVKGEIDQWKQWYGVDGIFFDEGSDQAGDIPYYLDLGNYVRASTGTFTVLNPGTTTVEGYTATVDVICDFEDTYANYVGASLPSWRTNYSRFKFLHLVHATATAAQMTNAINLAKSRNAGYVYATDDTIASGDVWNTLPAYWSAEQSLIAASTTNQTGVAAVTATVTDGGGLIASRTFNITVNATNFPPAIAAISSKSLAAGSVLAVTTTVSDAETAAGSLTVVTHSANTGVVTAGTASNSGGNVSFNLTGVAAGSTTVSAIVSDGTSTTTNTFNVTVTAAINNPPTITSIAAQTVNFNTASGALAFTIGDDSTPMGSLVLGKITSNPILVPAANIVFGGSGASRTVTVTPATGQSGSCTITLSVTDAQGATTTTSFTFTVLASGAHVYYASPTGLPTNTGTQASPWDLQTALNNTNGVLNGDTIWVRGGTYNNVYQSRLSTASGHITVRAFTGERPIINAGNGQYLGDDNSQTQFDSEALHVMGHNVWFWGLWFQSQPVTRRTEQSGSFPLSAPDPILYPYGPVIGIQSGEGDGTKFINCVAHDTQQGWSWWDKAQDTEMFGCISYYNGWDGSDRGHGHNCYVQNVNGRKKFDQNIVWSGFGEGIQFYEEGGSHEWNLDVWNNAIFNAGELGHTGQQRDSVAVSVTAIQDFNYQTNSLYYGFGQAGQTINYGGYGMSGAGSTGGSISDNYIVNRFALHSSHSGLTVANNTVYANLENFTTGDFPGNGNTYTTLRPGSNWPAKYYRNAYEPGRGHVVLNNWTLAASFSLDPAQLGISSGTPVWVFAATRPDTAVLKTTYTGSPVTLSTSLPMANPIGSNPQGNAPVNPSPEFCVWVVTTGYDL